MAELFAMLADRETAPPDTVPAGDLSPEWARKLSAPFVLDPGYGTRCSTVLTIRARARCASPNAASMPKELRRDNLNTC